MAAETQSVYTDAREDDTISLVALFESVHTEEVCPFGDVTLVLDDGFHPTTHIRVSSCILAMASPVFKALFSDKYSEGQNRSHDLPGEIGVKEDSPNVMIQLCKLLHLQDYERPRFTLGDLEVGILELAILIDKYDCIESLRLASDAILSEISDRPWGVPELSVAASYLLDQPKHFRRFTRALVMQQSVHIGDLDKRCCSIVPAEVISKFIIWSMIDMILIESASLHAQQSLACQQWSHQLTNLIDKFVTASEQANSPELIQDFLNRLSNLALWPLEKKCHTTPLHLALHLEMVDIPTIIAAEKPDQREHARNVGWGRSRSVSRYSTYSTYYENRVQPAKSTDRDIKIAIDRVKELCVGACLDCVRGSKRSPGECRVAHTDPWRAHYQYQRGWNDDFGDDEPEEPVRPSEWEAIW